MTVELRKEFDDRDWLGLLKAADGAMRGITEEELRQMMVNGGFAPAAENFEFGVLNIQEEVPHRCHIHAGDLRP